MGTCPQLDHLKIFGSKAFVLTPPEKRHRLDGRATEARVMGYVDGGKGWLLWVPKTDHELVSSAWVEFADAPMRLTTGNKPIPANIDPKLT